MKRRGCFFTHKSEFLSELDLALDVALQLGDGHTHLLHGVAVTDGDAVVGHDALGLVAHGVKVHGVVLKKGPRHKLRSLENI